MEKRLGQLGAVLAYLIEAARELQALTHPAGKALGEFYLNIHLALSFERALPLVPPAAMWPRRLGKNRVADFRDEILILNIHRYFSCLVGELRISNGVIPLVEITRQVGEHLMARFEYAPCLSELMSGGRFHV